MRSLDDVCKRDSGKAVFQPEVALAQAMGVFGSLDVVECAKLRNNTHRLLIAKVLGFTKGSTQPTCWHARPSVKRPSALTGVARWVFHEASHRHCERSEAIQFLPQNKVWIASLRSQ